MTNSIVNVGEARVAGFQRLEFEGTPIWVAPEVPDWIVPNSSADRLLGSLAAGQSPARAAEEQASSWGVSPPEAAARVEAFLARLERQRVEPYQGRAARLQMDGLRETWLHLTNRCNLACAHCMFASSPRARMELPASRLLPVIREAARLGCDLFFLTGGEPLVHEEIGEILELLAGFPESHTVIMTNALALPRVRGVLDRLSRDRFHFQVSLDGPPAAHDRLRGPGTYEQVSARIRELVDRGFPVSLAMAVDRESAAEMPHLVQAAAELGVGSVHFLWYFVKGKGEARAVPDIDALWEGLRRAGRLGAELGVEVDNLESLRAQVFSLPGTRYDLTNAGWQSVAVGPDGNVYPTAALVLDPELVAGNVAEGLETAWRHGPCLERLRKASLIDAPEARDNPLAFLIGGGDIDHSWVAGGQFVGADPYTELYDRTALWLIAGQAGPDDAVPFPALRARMGERLDVCGEEDAVVGLAHSNCVLSLPAADGVTLIKRFYAAAAREPNREIVNPVGYDQEVIAHVPEPARRRSYGCGSPVLDAELAEGETVVDLGCGAGVECFIAARKVGRRGRVIGIDMLEEMLGLAETGAEQVRGELGWDNLEFREGRLEDLPLADDSVDVVLSNCVINLSIDKRRTLAEIRRVLRPCGRLVISDVVSDGSVPLEIRYNEKLRGECLGGAMDQGELFALLEDVGFSQAFLIKRFPYRQVRGHRFFSLTYRAYEPAAAEASTVAYRGPFAGVMLEEGGLLPRGRTLRVKLPPSLERDPSLLRFDEEGAVTNLDLGEGCGCFTAPETGESGAISSPSQGKGEVPRLPDREGCMVCGAPLRYAETDTDATCHYCSRTLPANAACEAGHFVCDECHSHDAIEVITSICESSVETDLIALFERVRKHPAIAMHGPEYHAMVPAVIVAVGRESGLALNEEHLYTAVQRGRTVAGGACAFLGACGAALGVGAAFSVILGANPYMGDKRQQLHRVTTRILRRIGSFEAARCCQRDAWTALIEASALSQEFLGLHLAADHELVCRQSGENLDCLRVGCPLWPGNKGTTPEDRRRRKLGSSLSLLPPLPSD